MRVSIVLGILATILFLPSIAACADPITTFVFAGTWDAGSIPYGAFGTVTVDTATGTVQAIDLTFESLAGDAVVAYTQSQPYGTPPDFTEIAEGWAGPLGVNYSAAIDLLLPAPTLVGYTGGNICSVANPCTGAASIIETGIVDHDFLNGELTPTPEPSSLALLCIGMMTVVGTLRSRLFCASRSQAAPAPSA